MKIEKKFDAVKMMREIRDKLSKELRGMGYEEQKVYIKKSLRHAMPKQKVKKDAQVA